jgi:hypothetical protein
MTTAVLKDSLFAQMDKLPYDLQLRVLDFANSLIPKGVEGKSLLRFEGVISGEDLHSMSRAIEDNCERVDTNEW